MNRKESAIMFGVLLFMVIPELHLILNSFEPNKVDLFIFCDVNQDIQWYFKDMLDIIALIVLSSIIYILASDKIKIIALSLIIINFVKVPLYWLFYLQFDWAANITIFTLFYIKYLYEKRGYFR